MRTKKTMKLMSWNINGRTDKKVLGDQLSKIKNENADILALQEVKPKTLERFKKELAESDLKHVETRSASQAYTSKARDSSLLIASRWEVKQIEIAKVPWEESILSVLIDSPYEQIELHTVHVPNASGNGRQIKVDTFNALYKALSKKSDRHRILCGDFNSPKEEQCDGTTRYFGSRKEHRQSEERVLSGLAGYNLTDTYIKLCGYARIKHNGYEGPQYSHVNNNPRTPRRRSDHIFSSGSLNPTKCDYLHSFLDEGLSDHAPVYAVYKPKLL